jgi:hypothetical protein
MGKPRRSGMRRAYLKKTSYTYDDSPDSTLKASIGLGRNINPITATPKRAMLWLDKNKHTPTMTKPMAERTEAWHHHIKEDPRWWMQTCVDSSLNKIQMFFNGFTDRSVYYFKWLDKLSGVERESFTMSKDTALRIKANGLKGIIWK